MSDPFGSYDTSYPPELWEAPAAPPIVGAARVADGEVDGKVAGAAPEKGAPATPGELVETADDGKGEPPPPAVEGEQAPRTAPARRSTPRAQGRRHKTGGK